LRHVLLLPRFEGEGLPGEPFFIKAEPMIRPLRNYWSRLNEERSKTPEVISFRT
jgi:hypothetical protein